MSSAPSTSTSFQRAPFVANEEGSTEGRKTTSSSYDSTALAYDSTRSQLFTPPEDDSKKTSYHKRLFLLGFLCPPVWWWAAWSERDIDDPFNLAFRFRCQAMTTVTTVSTAALLILTGLEIHQRQTGGT